VRGDLKSAPTEAKDWPECDEARDDGDPFDATGEQRMTDGRVLAAVADERSGCGESSRHQ
jgi:hypothetical protein